MDNQNMEQNQTPKQNYDIHVMPDKFYVEKPKKSKKWIIWLLLALIIILGLAIGIYYLSQNMGAPAVNTNANANLNNANDNQSEVKLNENVNTNPQLNENLNKGAANLNDNTNTAPVFNENTEVGVKLESSADADKDSLTDVEEALYQTEVNKPDTDLDGFLDGQEVEGGYNPKAAGGSKIIDSGLANTYLNNQFKYSVYYPASWLAKPVDASLQSVVFQSASGEYLQVLVENNEQNLGMLEWFLTQSPTSDPNKLKSYTTKQGLTGIISEDGLTYYLADKTDRTKIYIVTYNVGTKTTLNFLTTFKMMINSLLLQ